MEISKVKFSAVIDLLLLAVPFWSLWSLRFLGVNFIGALTMSGGILTVLLLLRWRHQSLATLGLKRFENGRWLLSRTALTAATIGLTLVVVGGLASVFLGGPSEASAISQQPKGFWLFLLDVTLVTWVLIGFGEEFVFRGFILNRLLVLTGETRPGRVMACLLQAIWFGAGHASQGLTGMLMTGAVGFMLALVFLTRTNRNLWPLIIAHGTIDSVALTMTWLANR